MFKRKLTYILLIIIITASVFTGYSLLQPDSKNYIVSAYLPLWKQWEVRDIDSDTLTHIHLAFATIAQNHKIELKNLGSMDVSDVFSKIELLRKENPQLKISIAVGGYGADGFSDMALTQENRNTFANSVIDFIDKYNLDGVDLDWEFPVQGGWGSIKARKEDKENFTFLIKTLREKLDEKGKQNNKKYELSYAATVQPWGIENIELKKITPMVDYINLMCYDYTGMWSGIAEHNSGLYNNKARPQALNTHHAVNEYMNKGVPAEKLILGISAYGYGWSGVKSTNNGLFQTAEKSIDINSTDLSYKSICNNYIGKRNFTRYWDDVSKVPYLYNGNEFITFDDKQSVSEKMRYVKKKGLGGAMCWEYTQDNNGELIKAMYEKLYGLN